MAFSRRRVGLEVVCKQDVLGLIGKLIGSSLAGVFFDVMHRSGSLSFTSTRPGTGEALGVNVSLSPRTSGMFNVEAP